MKHFSSKQPTIAVIDDEPGIRKGLSRLLRAADLAPRMYESAQAFLGDQDEQPPDCVVVDLQMPGLSGLEMQTLMKRDGSRTPIIVITAHDEPEVQRRCLALGAVAYLCKPLDGEELLDVIWKALGQGS
jgi:FixJ family two-component response regulator